MRTANVVVNILVLDDEIKVQEGDSFCEIPDSGDIGKQATNIKLLSAFLRGRGAVSTDAGLPCGLRKNQVHVFLVNNGSAAIEFFRSRPGLIDLFICDGNLSLAREDRYQTGPSVIRAMKDDAKIQLPHEMVAWSATLEDNQNGFNAVGINDSNCLKKHGFHDRLRELLALILASKQQQAELVAAALNAIRQAVSVVIDRQVDPASPAPMRPVAAIVSAEGSGANINVVSRYSDSLWGARSRTASPCGVQARSASSSPTKRV